MTSVMTTKMSSKGQVVLPEAPFLRPGEGNFERPTEGN